MGGVWPDRASKSVWRRFRRIESASTDTSTAKRISLLRLSFTHRIYFEATMNIAAARCLRTTLRRASFAPVTATRAAAAIGLGLRPAGALLAAGNAASQGPVLNLANTTAASRSLFAFAGLSADDDRWVSAAPSRCSMAVA